MGIYDYIKTWDQIILDWFDGRIHNSQIGYEGLIDINYMPEPYLGDIDNCSFVIVNLNPGPGQCHSCASKKNVKNTLIYKVFCSSYSTVIKSFPYLKDGKPLGLDNWEKSPGRKWWRSKERWIMHILESLPEIFEVSKKDMPFAMELLGWHSDKWPSRLNKEFMNDGIRSTTFKNDVLDPLYEAIDKSTYKFAFCIGKPIGDIIASYKDYKPLTLPFGWHQKDDGYIVNSDSTSRNYRVLADCNNHFIINTWAQGCNTYPASCYEVIEQQIINFLK